MDTAIRDAEAEREHLIQKYIKDKRYSDFETQADGINHLAFVAKDLDETIEFYTQVVGLKLLRVRTLDGDEKSTMVFFDLGRGELNIKPFHTRSSIAYPPWTPMGWKLNCLFGISIRVRCCRSDQGYCPRDCQSQYD